MESSSGPVRWHRRCGRRSEGRALLGVFPGCHPQSVDQATRLRGFSRTLGVVGGLTTVARALLRTRVRLEEGSVAGVRGHSEPIRVPQGPGAPPHRAEASALPRAAPDDEDGARHAPRTTGLAPATTARKAGKDERRPAEGIPTLLLHMIPQSAGFIAEKFHRSAQAAVLAQDAVVNCTSCWPSALRRLW